MLSDSGAPIHRRACYALRVQQGVTIQTDPATGHVRIATDSVVVGSHIFPFDHHEWSHVRTFSDLPIIAFVRSPIEVSIGLDAPAVLTGAVAATPPANTDYIRTPRSKAGHNATWCQLTSPGALSEIVALFDPAAIDRAHAPFPKSVTRAHPLATHALERIAHNARMGSLPDPLELDEAVLMAAEHTAAGASPERRTKQSVGGLTASQRRSAVNAACETLALRFDESLSIAQIAQTAGYSPAFLSRCFREALGLTMHDYLTTLRLREAISRLHSWTGSIAHVAALTGFASHAHLTTLCSTRLGVTPSAIARASRADIRSLLDLLQRCPLRTP